jgi:hypothetical protein
VRYCTVRCSRPRIIESPSLIASVAAVVGSDFERGLMSHNPPLSVVIPQSAMENDVACGLSIYLMPGILAMTRAH